MEERIGKNLFLCLALFGTLAQLIPRVYTYYISTALFAFFGLKMLKEGYYMKDSDAQEELEEVQSDLKKREDQVKIILIVYLLKVANVQVWALLV